MATPRPNLDDLRRLADALPAEPARAALRRILDALPEDRLHEAQRILEEAGADDPVARALAEAPEDDEPWTEEDEEALRESEADYTRGDVVHEDELDTELARLRAQAAR